MPTHLTLVRRSLAVFAAGAVLLLAACTPIPSGAIENYPGLPPVEMPGEGGSGTLNEDGRPHAMWLHEGGQIAVITYGSSSCPLVGESLDVVKPAGEGNVVRVNLAAIPEDKACTRDLVPHTTVFYTPQDSATYEPLTVEIGEAKVTVPVK